jgi:hypothetical protein
MPGYLRKVFRLGYFFTKVVDAGNNAALPPESTTDLDEGPSFVDIPAKIDTSSGSPPLVDNEIDLFYTNTWPG